MESIKNMGAAWGHNTECQMGPQTDEIQCTSQGRSPLGEAMDDLSDKIALAEKRFGDLRVKLQVVCSTTPRPEKDCGGKPCDRKQRSELVNHIYAQSNQVLLLADCIQDLIDSIEL